MPALEAIDIDVEEQFRLAEILLLDREKGSSS